MKKIAFSLILTVALAHCAMVRDDAKEVVTDTTTKLMWQDNEEAKIVKKNWEEAKQYCEDLVMGGYSDWFLPTIDELLTIKDKSKLNPAISSVFNNVQRTWYWSSSPDVSDEGVAWGVDFDDGMSSVTYKTFASRVRCARDSTGTSTLLAAHNKKLAKADETEKIAQEKYEQEQKISEERQAQERQRLIQEKNRKSAESVKNFVGGLVSLYKGVNGAMENTAAKFYGLTPDQCKRVEIYYGTSNIGRQYKVLQGVSNATKFDFQCTAAQIGATAIINANANCRRAAVVKRGWFSNSIENEETCTYTGTAVK